MVPTDCVCDKANSWSLPVCPKELSLAKGGTAKRKRSVYAVICINPYFDSKSEDLEEEMEILLALLGLNVKIAAR